MKHTIVHDLGSTEQARRVVDEAYGEYERRLGAYQPTLTWLGPERARIEFTVMGKALAVTIELSARDLTVEGKLPLVFRPFQGKILSVLEREVQVWARRAQAPAADEITSAG